MNTWPLYQDLLNIIGSYSGTLITDKGEIRHICDLCREMVGVTMVPELVPGMQGPEWQMTNMCYHCLRDHKRRVLEKRQSSQIYEQYEQELRWNMVPSITFEESMKAEKRFEGFVSHIHRHRQNTKSGFNSLLAHFLY